ncbi:MAG: hypothetical protein LBE67_04105 [Kocuria palustris]|nr:hypothetical protein [Kocuria palustris]
MIPTERQHFTGREAATVRHGVRAVELVTVILARSETVSHQLRRAGEPLEFLDGEQHMRCPTVIDDHDRALLGGSHGCADVAVEFTGGDRGAHVGPPGRNRLHSRPAAHSSGRPRPRSCWNGRRALAPDADAA